MPSVSKSQQRLMQAAEHGATFSKAEKLRETMSHDQLHEFSIGSEADKPEKVGSSLLSGNAPSIVSSNTNSLKQSGKSEFDATKEALSLSGFGKARKPKHKNLGKFLHPRKDGKPHGSF